MNKLIKMEHNKYSIEYNEKTRMCMEKGRKS